MSKCAAARIQLFVTHVELLECPMLESTEAIFARVKQFVEVQAQLGYRWIHVHASTPCSLGSPLKHFRTGGVGEADVAQEGIMKAVPQYLTLGNSRSFERKLYLFSYV